MLFLSNSHFKIKWILYFIYLLNLIFIVVFLTSVEIILRAEAVEQAQAGDKCDFTGTLIVVPDVAQLSTPGNVYYFGFNNLKDI